MATCDFCELEMLTADGCTGNQDVLFPDGERLPAIAYGLRSAAAHFVDLVRCSDCNVIPGQYHHPGCDCEVCPRCNGQLISCGCLDED